jgi:hypothetical protein
MAAPTEIWQCKQGHVVCYACKMNSVMVVMISLDTRISAVTLNSPIKRTVPRDFRLLVFFHESVSPKHLSIPLRPFQIFSKIRGNIRGSRCTTSVVDTGGKWKKSLSRKILIILFGHLWVVELTYIYIFAFKFTLSCLQPESVLIILICHRRR